MAARVPLSWLILLLIVGVFAFFGYHILQASERKQGEEQKEQYHVLGKAQGQGQGPQGYPIGQHVGPQPVAHQGSEAPSFTQQVPAPLRMPVVPGQSEEELREHEPLQASPPATQYEAPDAVDPMNRTAYMNATFGDNLRHPEQMMEARPPIRRMDSGLESEQSVPGPHNASEYSPEMAQNGGEFMRGISAFENDRSGYSMV